VGRFLALAPVTSGKATKTTKFIHALGLVPILAHPPPTTAASTLPCPFLTTTTASGQQSSASTTAKKVLPSFAVQGHSASSYTRFATTNNKRSRNGDNDNDNNNDANNSLEAPDDPSINTLFLYGLHKDVTGELQSTSSPKVLLAFHKYGVEKVRHPPNTPTSTYCFLEFPTQQKALECLLACQGRISIDSVDLTLKWATQTNKSKKPRTEERHYVTHAEALTSTTLYFHPPKQQENAEQKDDVDTTHQAFATSFCNYLQTTLEDALNEGNTEERITAETEPALKVEVRTKDHYGFLQFASHAAATMALAAVTNSTDGGLVVENDKDKDKAANLVGTTLRWAKGEEKKSGRDDVLEALGLKRQYYPADSRTDCWFCLASPTCETNLITGVYREWYAAMPKGAVHPGHVLLVPVSHTKQGAWTMSSSSSSEFTELISMLQQHANHVYDRDLLVFERAMETKGGYHTHVQCVPIPKDSTTRLQATMMAHAKASGFDLRHIQSDLTIKSMISSEDSYFCAEILTPTQKHRFLYKRNEDDTTAVVPLQFAREVLASVLKDPKLAHWKSCVVDKEEETKIASEFRKSFADFSSS
jgi:diadenosine tetraphosphate (Ap4A) HIT family hydrolase